FGAIKFTAEGTYYFTITETAGSTHGMTYDTAAKYAIVTITKSGNTFAKTVKYGTTTAGTDGDLTVTNTYNKPNIDVDLSVGKTVTAEPTGSYQDDEDFTFTLGEDSGNDKDGYTMPTDKTATTKQNGTATFDSINFVKEGTYIFTIKENKGSTHGMTYDQSENYAKVVIEKNGDTFKKTVTYGSDKTNIADGSLSVNNDYTKPEGSVVLKATKKINGTYTGSETFTFTMSEDDPTAKGYIFPTSDLVKTVGKNETASFGEIKFTAAGTYYFKITESGGSTIGMTYDTDPKIAKVVVEANGGSFKTTVTYGEDKNAKSDSLDITNTFFLSRVKISKVDVADDSELAGATLGIYDSTGTNLVQMLDETTQTYVNATWTSGTDVKEVVGLAAGTYVLRETVAPTGYAITTDITFTLDDAGNVTSTAKNNDGVILVKDSKTSVKITKVDVTSHQEVSGAHIQLIDNTSTIVDQWDSTGTPKEIKGLATGVTYTLRETVAPNGYAITTDTTFILNDDGSIDTTNSTTTVGDGTNGPDGVLLVEDDKTSIKITKVDIADGAEIAGAHIQILEGSNLVDEWDSTGAPKEITGLKTDVEYTLRETTAPTGYKTTTDTKFKLNKDGTVNTTDTTTTIGNGTNGPSGVLLVEDGMTSIKITKVDIANGAEISGAHIQILEGTNVIDQWDSTGAPKDIVGLKTGVEYTLRETTAPDGYTITTDTKFKLKADGSIDDTVTTTHVGDGTNGPTGVLLVEDKMTSIKITKVDITDGAEVAGAHIQILEGETVVRQWDSQGTPEVITGLKTGVEYTLRETVAPTGYTIATDTKFKINTDGTIDSSSTTKVGDGTIGPNGVLLVQDDLIYIDIEGAKTWTDANNQDNKRPTSITIHLSADGTEVANKTVTATDNWKWKFTHLPEYNKGKKIVYTITEDTVSSYNS
ncbi:MAG: Cna B-type domain-containing protein, partial [Erysipelotrichaceae bacterium]|nr:Cna B-type domain-containing protein [Erysipelotrichaceae bacterium]